MPDDNENLSTGGTDTAKSTSAENPENWNYDDSDEDQNTVEPSEETGTEDVEESTEETPETTEQTDEASDEDQDTDDQPKVTDDVKVTLRSGEEVTLSELKKGYVRQEDYTRKTTELAQRRTNVEAQTERITRTIEGVAEFLAKQIPPEPDAGLAWTDPNAHYQLTTQRNAIIQQIDALVNMANEPKKVTSELSSEQTREQLLRENELLLNAVPEISKPEKRAAFFETTSNTAKSLGFSDDEIRNVADHRIFMLAHWAAKGLAADKATKAAKAKVLNVPPVASPQRKQSVNGNDNRDAMRRLNKSGSIKDALSIDFD
jgi:hypothetical protein